MVLSHETQNEISEWASTRRALRGVGVPAIIRFFAQAVTCTQHHDRTWFRLRDSTAALILGHLYTAAILTSGDDKGVLLMVAEECPPLDGFEMKIVKSAPKEPIRWAHSSDFQSLHSLDNLNPVWNWFAAMSDPLYQSRMSSAAWDEKNQKSGNRRLTSVVDDTIANPVSANDVDMLATTYTTVEGKKRLAQHLIRERDRYIVDLKKRSAASLACEACGFLFADVYGDEYCEVHHEMPLGQSHSPVITTLDSLAILCANCHRVGHLHDPPLSVRQIRDRIHEQQERRTNPFRRSGESGGI